MKYLEKFLFKYLKLYLLFCLVCFAFVLYKSDYFDETLIILLLFLFVYSISKYIYNKIYEKNVKKIVDVSNNIKNLSELNKKYNFLKIKNKSRVFREREYSVKSYERVLEKDILMYHIENNTDYIREDILNAYKNKKLYDKYLEEYNKLYQIPDSNESFKINMSEKKYLKLEKKIFENNKIVNVFDINVMIYAFYSSKQGQNHYSKKKMFYYQDLCDAYMEWKHGKKYSITSKFEREAMNDDIRYNVLKRDNFRCCICGATANDGVKLHVDHIVPVSKGGKTVMNNLQTLCERCNKGKSNKI